MKCFFIEPTGQLKRWLRRYVGYRNGDPSDPARRACTAAQHGYHQVFVDLDIIPLEWKNIKDLCPESEDDGKYMSEGPAVPRDDPRWPKTCPCGRPFEESDEWQIFIDRMYRRTDTGEQFPLREAPVGSMWWAEWLPKHFYWDNKEDDHLMVMLPDKTQWNVDSRANNCTMPDDRTHRCWVRTGEPPMVTAGKSGHTCAAGAGSIASPGWHGFLTNGELVG